MYVTFFQVLTFTTAHALPDKNVPASTLVKSILRVQNWDWTVTDGKSTLISVEIDEDCKDIPFCTFSVNLPHQ